MTYRCKCLTKAGDRCKNKITRGKYCHIHRQCENPVNFGQKKSRRSRTRSRRRSRTRRSRSRSVGRKQNYNPIVDYEYREPPVEIWRPDVLEVKYEERLPSVKKLQTVKPLTIKKQPSVVVQKSVPKKPPTAKKQSVKKDLGSTPTKEVNKGLQMMLKMGYKVGEPLGIRGEGILSPIKAIEQSSFAYPAKIKN